MHKDKYATFAALLKAERSGIDYEIVEDSRPGANTIIIAPHGGRIEPETSEIARAIAGDTYSYYAFEGRKQSRNYQDLHITSHSYDEPRAVALVQAHRWVVAVHGCSDAASRVLLGGRDRAMVEQIASELHARGVSAETTGHPFPGLEAANICNRGSSGTGVQIELSRPFRTGDRVDALVVAVRSVLKARTGAA